MTTLEFLSHLRGKDVKLWIEDDKLRFRAPERAITPELKAEMAARKAEIIGFLRNLRDTSRAEMPPIARVGRDQPLPLSFSQQRLWFLDQLFPGVPLYNLYGRTELKRALDEDALQLAFTEIVRRHEILRTTFQSVDGVPFQIISPPAPFPLEIIDLRNLPFPAREAEAERMEEEEARLPFDLVKGPLMRAKLLRLAENHYHLLFSIHHIIMDDWSRKLFDQELDTLYTAFSQSLPSPLPELPIQYADFAAWQCDWMQGKVLESYVDYWVEQLKGELPFLDLPADRVRAHSCKGAEGRFSLPRSLSLAIKTFSDREGVTPFMTLIAAYSALLSRYTGHEDIIIGSPIADRNQPETTRLIGFLLNSLVLRMNLSGNPTFREFLKRVKEVCIGAHAHQEVPYEALMKRLHLNRTLSGSPIFQTMMVLLNTPNVTRSSEGLWAGIEEDSGCVRGGLSDSGGEPFRADRNNGTAKFDLSFVMLEKRQVLYGIVEYNTDLFDHETIARFVERLQLVLQSVTTNAEQHISELPLMTEVQQQELMAALTGRKEQLGSAYCIHQLIETRAQQSPGAIAAECNGKSLTYAELNVRANQCARFLQTLGVGPEGIVGIFLERSLEMLIAMVGALKAGAAYLPLDPSYPQKRLAFMLEDACVKVLLTQSALLPSLPRTPAITICMDSQWEKVARHNQENLPCRVTGKNRVCVLYTSGSTGQPKGVMLTHEALTNYALGAAREYQLVQTDRVLQFASVSFDLSLEEIYPCLVRGATLVLRPAHMLDSIATFLSCCCQMKLTVLDLPTAYWHEIVSQLEMGEHMPPTLRLVVIGGEKATPEKLSIWQKFVADQIMLVNTYGPTEGTIAVTRGTLPGFAIEEAAGKEVPLGYPIENTRIYLLDPWMQSAPVGIPGILHIGGTALARGYLNRPDLTAERFLPDPFSSEPGARIYNTGDLVRLLPNGTLEYRGRADQQIKIRGYRIEPGEIEAALESHPRVVQAVVVLREDEPGEKRLAAYLVAKTGDNALNKSDLRLYLKQRLPDYMIPVAFVQMEKFPLTPNGKLDRKALPLLDDQAYGVSEYEPPQGDTENTLAAIWAEVLHIGKVGRHDNFFELGGDSLLSLRLVARMRRANLIATPKDILQNNTIAKLAVLTKTLASQAIIQEVDEPTGIFDVTPTIARVRDINWPIKEYGSSAILQLPEGLRQDFLIAALQTILDHHDMLRLQLRVNQELQWKLHIRKPGSVFATEILKRVSLTGLGQNARLALLSEESEAAKNRLDPQAGRVIQVVWFDAGVNQPGALALVINHLAMDGVSWQLLVTDLKCAYESLKYGDRPDLGPKGTSYRRWSELLISEANRAARIKEFSFWQEVMSPGGELVPGEQLDGDAAAGKLFMRLPASVMDRLLAMLSAKFHASLNDVLLTALALAANAWRRSRGGNSNILTVDVNGHGREDIFPGVDLSRTIGWFTTLYPVRLDLTGIDPVDLEEALRVTMDQLRIAPDNGIGYGIIRYLNAEIGPTLKQLGRPHVSFNYVGKSGGFVRKDWAMLSPEAYVNATNRPASPDVIKFHSPNPLEHLVFISVVVQETTEGSELEACVGWAASILDEVEVRSLTETWFQMLRRFADFDSSATSAELEDILATTFS